MGKPKTKPPPAPSATDPWRQLAVIDNTVPSLWFWRRAVEVSDSLEELKQEVRNAKYDTYSSLELSSLITRISKKKNEIRWTLDDWGSTRDSAKSFSGFIGSVALFNGILYGIAVFVKEIGNVADNHVAVIIAFLTAVGLSVVATIISRHARKSYRAWESIYSEIEVLLAAVFERYYDVKEVEESSSSDVTTVTLATIDATKQSKAASQPVAISTEDVMPFIRSIATSLSRISNRNPTGKSTGFQSQEDAAAVERRRKLADAARAKNNAVPPPPKNDVPSLDNGENPTDTPSK